MKVKEIIKQIELHAPKSLMHEYDYAGLNLGDENIEVENVLVCLNVTFKVLDEAIKKNCNLIISHHPAIFGDELDEYTKKLIRKAKRNHLVLYSAHTNLDAAEGGINDKLCQMLKVDVLEGFGHCYRIGKLKQPKTLREQIKEIKAILSDRNIKSIGNNKIINTVCISSGAGARDDDLIEYLHQKKVDLLIGGENKLSIALKMRYYNIGLIEVGHFSSEICAMDILKEWLQELKINVYKSEKDTNPYNK